MLSERQLRALLVLFDERMQGITSQYLAAMGEHIKNIGSLLPSDVHRLTEMRRSGLNTERIQREIVKSAEISVADLNTVFRAVAESNQQFAEQWFGSSRTPRVKGAPQLSTPIERSIKAQLRVTAQAFKNLSQTTIQSGAYQNAVDAAVSAVQSGVTDYTSAIRNAVREAGRDGLRVQYPSGVTRRLDTAVRQNVLDGVRSLNNDILQQLGNEYGADGIELSAHALCATDHLPYQGKQFSTEDFAQLQNTLERPFGQWNCRHTMFPIILGVSKPVHSDEELAAYARNSQELIEIDGRAKTRYEWTQEQRRIETAIRQQKDVANLAKACGDDTLRREAQANINALQNRYAQISKAAGLAEQPQRTHVAGFRSVKTAEQLKNPFVLLKNKTQDGILVVTEKHDNTFHVGIQCDTPNAVIDITGKKGGISRFIYDENGKALYRVDNNNHGRPKYHPFKNGEHYHTAQWQGDRWQSYTSGQEIPSALRKLCADILKED